jgi:hypothetical protein
MLIFVNQIAYIRKCEKQQASRWLYYGTGKVQVGTKFLKLIPVYETKTGVFEHEFMQGDKYISTAEEYNRTHKSSYCDGEDVYKKPHVEIVMSNNTTITKYFETVAEMDAFVESLDTRETISID